MKLVKPHVATAYIGRKKKFHAYRTRGRYYHNTEDDLPSGMLRHADR